MSNTTQHDWSWLIRFATVMVMALILATAFSSMDLFKQTWIIKNQLTAAKLVQFFGYCTALYCFWMIGQQLSRDIPQRLPKWQFLQPVVLPFVTLVVVAAAHSISLLVLENAMNRDMRTLYNWLFILAILGCAGWLVMAVLNQTKTTANSTHKPCPQCGHGNPDSARFCGQCARAL